MTTLQIDLQEGFEDDHVIITVDDRVVFDKSHVRTRRQISLAEIVSLELEQPAVQVKVSLPQRNLSASIHVPLDAPAHLFANITRDQQQILLQASSEPGRYA